MAATLQRVTVLYLFLGVVHSAASFHEHLCVCGETNDNSSHSPLECVRNDEDGYVDALRNSIMYTTQQTCSSYSINHTADGGQETCTINTGFTLQQEDDFCYSYNGGKACCIQSPNFGSTSCYPPLTYCAHSVTCPPGSFLSYHHSYMSLTADFPSLYGYYPSQCSDIVEVELDYLVHSRCGQATAPSTYWSYYGNLFVQFASNQDCQNIGYSMWANCIPIYYTYTQRLYNEYSTLANEVIMASPPFDIDPVIEDIDGSFGGDRHPHTEEPSAFTATVQEYQVNFSTIMKYTNSRVTVYQSDRTTVLKVFPLVAVLYLYDEEGVMVAKFENETSQDMYGYGIMKIQEKIGHYFQIGIPKELIPNEKEKKMIESFLSFITPYYTKIMKKNDHNAMLGDSKPCCLYSDLTLNDANCQSDCKFYGPTEKRKVLVKAEMYKKKCTNPVVLSTLNLVIKVLSDAANDNNYYYY